MKSREVREMPADVMLALRRAGLEGRVRSFPRVSAPCLWGFRPFSQHPTSYFCYFCDISSRGEGPAVILLTDRGCGVLSFQSKPEAWTAGCLSRDHLGLASLAPVVSFLGKAATALRSPVPAMQATLPHNWPVGDTDS